MGAADLLALDLNHPGSPTDVVALSITALTAVLAAAMAISNKTPAALA
jgi:hypothetical protein